MSSTIEFNEATITIEEANLTLPPVEKAFKNVNIASAKIAVRGSSVFQLTPILIQIRDVNLTVSGNSKGIFSATDEIIFADRSQANFTVGSDNETDSSEISIDNLDFLNDDYTGVQIKFNFDTSKGKNLGKFTFPGNGNAFACSKLFDLGFVYINNIRTPLNFNTFKADYSNNTLTLSLKTGQGPEESKG